MANGRDATPTDGNANPVANYLPKFMGNPFCLSVSVPGDEQVCLLDVLMDTQEDTAELTPIPKIQGWLIENRSEDTVLHVGHDGAGSLGVTLKAGSAADPTQFAAQWDPAKTYVHNPSSSAADVYITFWGDISLNDFTGTGTGS